MRFYAITDSDSDVGQLVGGVGRYQWDVYHIENYFLSPPHILSAMEALGQSTFGSDDEVMEGLRKCAEARLAKLVRLELASHANQLLVKAIDTSSDPNSAKIVAPLVDAISRSCSRISGLSSGALALDAIEKMACEIEGRYRVSLADGSWVRVFPGRDVLKTFVKRHVSGVQYERFRNLILSKMRDQGFQPEGMRVVVHEILNDAVHAPGSMRSAQVEPA